MSIYLDLPLHCDAEEHDEVHYENWPENRHIEDFEKCANHGDDDALRRRVPAERRDPGGNDTMTEIHEQWSRPSEHRKGPYTHQNLNSGNLLMKGRNSSFCLVGRAGPSSAGEVEQYRSLFTITYIHAELS